MICTKCGHEVPDGARFCTVCGTAVTIKSAEPVNAEVKKIFCTKCGNELQFGAKFCTVCGTPTANVGNAATAQNNGAAFGNGNISSNSEPNANDLIAAMNVAGAASAPVAEPVQAPVQAASTYDAAIEQPTEVFAETSNTASELGADLFGVIPESTTENFGGVPETAEGHINLEKPQMPTLAETVPAQELNSVKSTVPMGQPTQQAQPVQSAPEYNGGVSAPTPAPEVYPAASQVPNFAPTGGAMPNNPMGVGFNGMNGAAAVAAAPAKKGKGVKIVLIIVIVLVLLIGGAAAFFFTNRATFLSIVMGKPKYAATVEKDSIKKITEKLDAEYVCEQIKSFSSLMSAVSGANINSSNPIPSIRLSDNNADSKFVKLANSTERDGIDVKALIKGYNEFMQNVYGSSGISGTASVNLELGNKMKDEMDEDTNALIGLLFNGSEISYDFAATDKLIGVEGGIKINGKPLDAKVSVEEDGTAYISFPFVSEKALKVKIPTVDNGTVQETAVLDLDSKELERLISELTDIYTNYIKESSVTMENGTMIVGGTTVNGKQITAEIIGINLENLLKELFNHVANDAYLCDKITAYAKNFDNGFTAEDYKTEITNLINTLTIDPNDKLVVTTIVTNSGAVLSKNYTMIDGSSNSKAEIAFANDDTHFVLELKENDKTLLSVNNEKTSKKEGAVTVTVGTGNNESVGILVTYKDADKAKFGKKEIAVGSYTLKFDTSNVKDKDEDMEMLDGFTVSYTSSVESETAKVTAGIELKDYVKAEISEEMKITNDASKFAAPTDVIDISAAVNGEEPDEDTINAFKDYAKDLLNGVADVFAGTDFEEIVSQYRDSAVKELDKDEDAMNGAAELEQKVWKEYMEVYDWLSDNGVYTGAAYNNASDYQAKLSDLDERLYKAAANCTKEQLEAFQSEFDELMAQKNALKSAVEKAGKKNSSGNTSKPSTSNKTSSSNKANSSNKTSSSNKTNSSKNTNSSQSSKSNSSVKSSKVA